MVAEQTGLQVRIQDNAILREAILLRMKLLKLSRPEKYYQLLTADSAEGNPEWRKLVAHLITGESYFFRDKGQFNLLKNRILPELIRRNHRQSSLRIWSAGCSTGEEPYSLAILVDELLPHRGDWNIFVLGTDINEESVEKARQGVYGPWSLRAMEPDLRARYFHHRKNEWELDERIRAMVTFRYGNLLKDTFPGDAADIHPMDLILCRNVFIYFDSNAVSAVLQKFIQVLNGGYLMTGHNELHAQSPGCLRPRFFPESVIYQCGGDVLAKTSGWAPESPTVRTPVAVKGPVPAYVLKGGLPKAKSPPSAMRHPRSEWIEAHLPLAEAETFFQNDDYGAAIEKLEHLLQHAPRNFRALYLVAKAYANLGKDEKAAHYCRQALEADPFAAQPYYLLAHIAEERGDNEEAKDFLKKALYLSPSFIAAYLDLGALYDREDDAARARRMRETALELLKALPPHVPIEPYGEAAAGELALYVQKMLGEGENPALKRLQPDFR